MAGDTYTVDSDVSPAIEKDFAIEPGDGIKWTIAVQVNTAGSYAAKDMSGATVTLDVKDQDGGAEIAARSISESGDDSNELIVDVKDSDTTSWSGPYRYEVKADFNDSDGTFGSDFTRVLAAGTIHARDAL